MATYDQSQLSPEKVREARVPHLEKFAGDISIFWKAGEQQRYQEAMQLATQLAILNTDKFDQIKEGDKRTSFRDHLAQQINDLISTGVKPPEISSLDSSQTELAEKINAALPLWADKAAHDGDEQMKKAWVAQLYKSKLEKDQTRGFAESILLTVADILATKDLQQQVPSPVPRI